MKAWLKPVIQLRKMNWALTAAVAALTTLGVLFIYSACYVSEEMPVRHLYKQQIRWVWAGGVMFVAVALVDYRRWLRHAVWVYALSLVLLVFVLVAGVEVYGARRWISLFGEVGIQPSEFAKVSLVMVLAFWLGRPGEASHGWGAALATLALVAFPMALVLKQPDMGTALIFPPVAGTMLWVAGIRWRILAAMLAVAALGMGLVLGSLLLPEYLGPAREPVVRALRTVGVRDYHRERILGFLHADQDPMGAGWNKIQSRIAIGSGGSRGKGYLKGTQNLLGFLPRTVAPTDFIFSVVAEETGFAGSLMTLLLFSVVITAGAWSAWTAVDKQGQLLCIGAVAMVFFHVAVNVAMSIGLMPITGLPLPFLSYGGSFMVSTLALMGVIQSVHVRSQKDHVFSVV